MPILLVPGLVCSPRYFAPVVPGLWRFGPVTVANHIRDDNMGAIARHILADLMEHLRTTVRPGMSTLAIDEEVEAFITERGAAPGDQAPAGQGYGRHRTRVRSG